MRRVLLAALLVLGLAASVEAAWTLRSPNGTGSAGNTSGVALAVTKPSGVADGDLLIALAYLESDTNTWASTPAGWTTSASYKATNTGAFSVQVWWKIAASEGASWTWTPTTSAWRTIVVAAFTGGTGSGEFVDVAGAVGQADAVGYASQTAPSVTTLLDNDLVVCAYGNFSGAAGAVPVLFDGFATNYAIALGGVSLSSATKTPAGATGTTNPSMSQVGSETYAALHLAFRAAGATGGGGGGVAGGLNLVGVGR